MGYSNSTLVNYTKISPNKTSPRNHKIDTITIHHMAGNLSVETCGDIFAPTSRKASSNYGIGSDGRIGLYVDEQDRSWCTGSAVNDNRAITIEVANDGGDPDWHVSDKALQSLINLVTDICRRNDIKSLKWQGNISLIGNIEKQNMTVHRWFQATSCPGNYLYGKLFYIAEEVNKKLGSGSTSAGSSSTSSSNSTTTELYRIRKTWADASSQLGAFSVLNNAIAACKSGYSVFDSKGNAVYSVTSSVPSTPSTNTATFAVYQVKVATNSLSIRSGAGTDYGVIGSIKDTGVYTIVDEATGTGATKWGLLKSYAAKRNGWISLDCCKRL